MTAYPETMGPTVETAVAELRRLLGTGHVLTDAVEREFYSQDVYRSGARAAAIIRPGTPEELLEALRAVAAAGLPVVPRGGGMSYSDAYLPARENSIMVDTQRMSRVLEINVDDGYVTVECGITWKGLDDALAPRGVRTPYWGPLSGLHATVGGALSQGSVFLGSGRYGSAADSVLGLDVATVDGTLLRLGSHAKARGAPFFRQFGPDATGLFLSDTGALGIKARATLRLIRRPPETRYLSFVFETPAELFTAMADIAREELVSECFGFDPRLQAVRMRRASLKEDVKSLGRVMKAAGGGLAALKEGAQLVIAGRRFLGDEIFSLHLAVDGRDPADADAKAQVVRELLGGGAGREVENSVPKVLRAHPFAEVTSMLGPGGERWVPVHGTVPFSQATAMFAALEAVFARHAQAAERHRIDHGYLICTVGLSGILIEPVLYWPDARQLFHERVLPADYLASLPRHEEDLAAREAVARLREDLAHAFLERGAASFQIGRFYPYQEALDAGAAELLERLKGLLDPGGRMNPGSLGLPRAPRG